MKSLKCNEWHCNLYERIPLILKNILCMHNMFQKCVESDLQPQKDSSYNFQKRFSERACWEDRKLRPFKKAFLKIV